MYETLLKQEIPIGLGVGTILYSITSNWYLAPVGGLVTWFLVTKLNLIYLRTKEDDEKAELAGQWGGLLEECLEAKLKSDEVTEKAQLLASMQRDRVTSVEIDERVGKSLLQHIEFLQCIFGIRLKERRLEKMNQTVSHIERRAEELGYETSKVENNERVVITAKMRKMEVSEAEEEQALFEYVQNLPNIVEVEAQSVIKSPSGDHQFRPDFIVTNTLGERYIIELKTVRGSTTLAEKRAKEQLIRYGAEITGFHVMRQREGGQKIVYVGKLPTHSEEE